MTYRREQIRSIPVEWIRTENAGVEVHFKVWKDMNHTFHNLFLYIPEPNQAFERIREFIQRVTKI